MNVQALEQLLGLLANGRAHNGEALAQALGMSRAAVWKKIETLRELGLEIEGRAGTGYALAQPIERLDAALIRAAMTDTANAGLGDLRIVPVIDSTNSALRAESATLRSGTVLLSEAQTAGRGRRGRSWASPFASGFLGSLFWRFERGLTDLGGLSLAVGVALAEAWRAHGVPVQVKWPNDLWIEDRKVAGMLVEAGGEFHGPSHVVVGLGLNLTLPEAARRAIDQPVTALAEHLPVPMPRNVAIACCLQALQSALDEFAQHGLAAFAPRFAALDALRDRDVQVIEAQRRWRGRACGIDANGRMQVRDAQGVHAVDAADISISIDRSSYG